MTGAPHATDELVEIENTTIVLPKKFLDCEEIPACPKTYLGYFAVCVMNFYTGTILYNCNLEAPRYGSDYPVFTLAEIHDIVAKEVEGNRGLHLLHMLFYDDAYKRFEYLTEEKARQCSSFVFRVLVEYPPPAEEAMTEEEKLAKQIEEDEVARRKAKLDVGLPERMRELLVDKVSNPAFPDRLQGQAPYVSKRDLHQKAEDHVNQQTSERDELAAVEEEVRKEMRMEQYIYNATIQASRADALRERTLRKRIEALTAEGNKKESTARERQLTLMDDVRTFMETPFPAESVVPAIETGNLSE